MYCLKCGKSIPEKSQFCPYCGETISYDFDNDFLLVKDVIGDSSSNGVTDEEDIKNNKVLAIFAYFGILFLIPLLAGKDSKFARFHANQGIVLCIFSACYYVLMLIIGNLLVFFATSLVMLSIAGLISTILWLGSIAYLVFMIIGIVNVAQGSFKKLPLIGKINILK